MKESATAEYDRREELTQQNNNNSAALRHVVLSVTQVLSLTQYGNHHLDCVVQLNSEILFNNILETRSSIFSQKKKVSTAVW